jgi:hypothetical protein
VGPEVGTYNQNFFFFLFFCHKRHLALEPRVELGHGLVKDCLAAFAIRALAHHRGTGERKFLAQADHGHSRWWELEIF